MLNVSTTYLNMKYTNRHKSRPFMPIYTLFCCVLELPTSLKWQGIVSGLLCSNGHVICGQEVTFLAGNDVSSHCFVPLTTRTQWHKQNCTWNQCGIGIRQYTVGFNMFMHGLMAENAHKTWISGPEYILTRRTNLFHEKNHSRTPKQEFPTISSPFC
jgi:hypothetical protein